MDTPKNGNQADEMLEDLNFDDMEFDDEDLFDNEDDNNDLLFEDDADDEEDLFDNEDEEDLFDNEDEEDDIDNEDFAPSYEHEDTTQKNDSSKLKFDDIPDTDSNSDGSDGFDFGDLESFGSKPIEDQDFGLEQIENQDFSFGDIEEHIEDSSAYVDGTVVDVNLHDEDEEQISNEPVGTDFINSAGNIVVQDTSNSDDPGFEIIYLKLDQIAITNRIRKMDSVDALVQSIKSTGLLEPLVVVESATDDLYILISGYRRIQACARAGITKVPCIVNTKVSTPEIPILEAMYNHQKRYNMKEQIDYIEYLEKIKGIMNPAMIEYLLQMNNGDYTKLKDILNDDDEDIVTKLYDGVYDIATAFKKLEARRKKESREEKENKLADGVYGDEEESGVNQIEGSGEEADDAPLTEEQIQALAINVENLDEDAGNIDLAETVAEDDKLEGFEKHKQDVGDREVIDPAIRKATIIRDKGACQCCKRGGPQMADCTELHHVLPVFLGGVDSVDNSIMLCQTCHRMVHLYSTGDLTIDKALYADSFDEISDDAKQLYQNEQIFENEKATFKKIVYLGGKIRTGISQRGMNREQYKKEHPNHNIGKKMPGKNSPQAHA